MRDVYGRVAARYAEGFIDELARKPLDRALLDVFADDVQARGGCVADLGCGPAQVARFLRERGIDALGFDLAPPMVECARACHPGLDVRVGDMRALDLPDGALAGATAFYAIVHLAADELLPVFAEWRRVLAPGAPLLIAFHLGQEAVQPGEFLGEEVDIAWNFFPLAMVTDALTDAGLSVELQLERAPYPEEHPSVRGYVMARRPSGDIG